jgi:HAD-hyrolase-like
VLRGGDPHQTYAAIFQHALDGLGLGADQVWFVGDHPENDILGASRVGLRTVWLRGAHPWPGHQVVPYHQTTCGSWCPCSCRTGERGPHPLRYAVRTREGSCGSALICPQHRTQRWRRRATADSGWQTCEEQKQLGITNLH